MSRKRSRGLNAKISLFDSTDVRFVILKELPE